MIPFYASVVETSAIFYFLPAMRQRQTLPFAILFSPFHCPFDSPDFIFDFLSSFVGAICFAVCWATIVAILPYISSIYFLNLVTFGWPRFWAWISAHTPPCISTPKISPPHSAILPLCQKCIFFEKFFPLIYEICYIVILFLVLVYDIFVIRGKLPTRFCHRELWHSSCGSTYRKQDLVALV